MTRGARLISGRCAGQQLARDLQDCARHWLLGQFFNINQVFLFGRRKQGNRLAARTRTTRPADTVDIIFSAMWQVVIDDTGHSRDIETAGSHVGRHQNFEFTSFKGLERFHAISLRLITVYRFSSHAVKLKLTG